MPTAEDKEAIVKIPVKEAMLNARPYAVLNCNAPLEEDNPILFAPTCNDGVANEPTGICNTPDKVPPVNAKSKLECPVKPAVMTPAEKLPDISLVTMASAVFAIDAVVAVLDTNPLVVNVNNLSLEIDPASFAFVTAEFSKSFVAINEVDNTPAMEL